MPFLSSGPSINTCDIYISDFHQQPINNPLSVEELVMAKRMKTKEKMVKDGESVKDVSKDIDEIFSLKKPTVVAAEKTGKGIQKPKTLQTTPVTSAEGNLAIIQSQVRALKSKQSLKPPQTEREDDFADIRGTKKRNPIKPDVTLTR
jgi:hypothetical protein